MPTKEIIVDGQVGLLCVVRRRLMAWAMPHLKGSVGGQSIRGLAQRPPIKPNRVIGSRMQCLLA